jgi:hypothetical protein
MNKALANVTNVILKPLLIISTLILCYWIHNIQLTFSFVFLNHTTHSLLLPSINTTTTSSTFQFSILQKSPKIKTQTRNQITTQ